MNKLLSGTKTMGVMGYCLSKEGFFIGMHRCMGRASIEGENVTSDDYYPMRLRILFKHLFRRLTLVVGRI